MATVESVEKVVAHVDMDAFYASIEIRDCPKLRGKPVVVGGGSDQRGVVAAASYEARVFGVHSAMSMVEATRLCPDLVRIPPNMEKYQEASRSIMEVFSRYSPTVQPLSLDEAFLDLSGMGLALGLPEEIGRRIKRDILEETRLTSSVGIAPVKFVAKIASDLDKPDGFVHVRPGEVLDFLRPLPIARLWGVGPKTQRSLEALGIRTIGQLGSAPSTLLSSKFGQHGEQLRRLARGEDQRNVVAHWEAKSYSHEETFATDQEEEEVLESVLLDQAVRVSRRLRRDDVYGRVVQLKLRYADFTTLTRRQTIPTATSDADRIFDVAYFLLRKCWNGSPIRLLGVGVGSIRPAESRNLDLFDPHPARQRRERLQEAMDGIEGRFGRKALVRAKTLKKRSIRGTDTPSDRPLD